MNSVPHHLRVENVLRRIGDITGRNNQSGGADDNLALRDQHATFRAAIPDADHSVASVFSKSAVDEKNRHAKASEIVAGTHNNPSICNENHHCTSRAFRTDSFARFPTNRRRDAVSRGAALELIHRNDAGVKIGVVA